ncbi:hypothetical protein TRVL_08948 [Trypanosoma vivax]|nr:hypothetical protein TRVL_08948 [Trypanosoma vivax]
MPATLAACFFHLSLYMICINLRTFRYVPIRPHASPRTGSTQARYRRSLTSVVCGANNMRFLLVPCPVRKRLRHVRKAPCVGQGLPQCLVAKLYSTLMFPATLIRSERLATPLMAAGSVEMNFEAVVFSGGPS